MLKMRVIPCLDVKDGRVVKGVNFVDLRRCRRSGRAGQALRREGADELCFLDITASPKIATRSMTWCARTAEQCFMPLTVGGGVRDVDDIRKPAAGRRRQDFDQHRRGGAAGFRPRGGGEIRQPMHRRRHRRQGGGPRDRWEVFTHGGRRATGLDAVEWAKRMAALWRRRDPADLDGPRRHQAGLRHPADPRGGRCGRRSR